MWFWKEILRLIKPYSAYAVLSSFFSFLAIVFSLFSLTMIVPFLDLLFKDSIETLSKPSLSADPESISRWFNYYLSSIIDAQGKEAALWTISLIVIGLFFLKNLFRYLANFFMAPLRNKVLRNLRNQMYDKVLGLPLSYFSSRRAGDIMSRMSGDVQEVEWSVMSFLIMLFRQPIALLIFTAALIVISPELTLFTIILLPLAAFLISLSGKLLNRMAMKGQQQLGVLVSMIEETIGGIRIIKAFNAIDPTDLRFRKQNQDFTRILTRVYRQRDLAVPLTEILAILAMVSVIWFGGQQVLNPQHPMNAQVFLLYLAIFSQVIPPAKSLISAYYYIRKGEASMERIQEVLQEPAPVTPTKNDSKITGFHESIETRGLDFAYGSSQVLSGISFHLEKGQSLAIVGPSGSGKTSLLNLLPRFYDPGPGMIFIDGRDILTVHPHQLRSIMGFVTQDTILFNDTIRENITFGKDDVDEEDIHEAARIANADEFILQLPEGYNTVIGDRGVKLSGGQRQRLALARAVLRNPPILLLDEATSSLDTQSEKEVQEALDSIMSGRTSIIVAHRLSTVMNADKILVLDNGKLIEQGTHEELLSKEGLYHQLWYMQADTN